MNLFSVDNISVTWWLMVKERDMGTLARRGYDPGGIIAYWSRVHSAAISYLNLKLIVIIAWIVRRVNRGCGRIALVVLEVLLRPDAVLTGGVVPQPSLLSQSLPPGDGAPYYSSEHHA